MWGQAPQENKRHAYEGIIPTRVGTRTSKPLTGTMSEDHPHACGDKRKFGLHIWVAKGSSPRVWGQVCILFVDKFSVRIIPTRVGTRRGQKKERLRMEDHPHACGDKRRRRSRRAYKLGSSPRVWGQGFLFCSFAVHLRIIPTRVGTRLKKSRKIAVLQNQPLRFPLTFHRSFV